MRERRMRVSSGERMRLRSRESEDEQRAVPGTWELRAEHLRLRWFDRQPSEHRERRSGQIERN